MFTIPQAFRVVRRNTVEGISVSSQLQNLSGSILWVVYGFAAETYLVVLANVMTICGFGVVVLKQIQLGAVTFRKAFVVEACVIALAVSALVISQDILGVLAVVVGPRARPQRHARPQSGQSHRISAALRTSE